VAGVVVAAMTPAHAPEVLRIYQQGIDEGQATFETAAPSWEDFDASRLPEHRFGALADGDRAVGWAAVSPTSTRAVYTGVVEHSVYVDPDVRGTGVGRALLEALLASTEEAGIWTVQSAIFPENAASLALHQRLGFRVVGRRERVARHGDRWRDVLLVERRSRVAG